MNKVMETLFEIEDKAGNIIDKVSREKKALEDDLHRKMEAFERDIMDETNRTIEAMKSETETEQEKEKSRLYQNTSDYLKSYERKYRRDKEKIIDNIMKRITK